MGNKLAELIRSGRTRQEICKELGISMSTLIRKANKDGYLLPDNRQNKTTVVEDRGYLAKEELAQYIKLYGSTTNIHIQLYKQGKDICYETVRRSIKRHGLKAPHHSIYRVNEHGRWIWSK